MKKLVLLVVMFLGISIASLAIAAEVKMIGTVSAIEMKGNSAVLTMQDRKTDESFVLQVRDASTLEKIKDHKIRTGDELRLRFDKGSKVITYVRKTAGC